VGVRQLPHFSIYESVEIAPNLILNIPAPEEIAASKMAFADRLIRVKDLEDIAFIQEKFDITADQILRRIFGIEIESHRRCAIMNWNQLDRLLSEIPARQAELEKNLALVDRLEQQRANEDEGEEESRGLRI
jgi:hypothetical protein